MKKETRSKMDKVLEDVKKLREHNEAFTRSREKKISNTRIAQMQKDATVFYRFYTQVIIAAIWIYQHILRHIIWAAMQPAKWLFRRYKNLWSLVVYKRDKFGDLKLSKVRAGIFLMLTVGVFYTAPIWGEFLLDTGLFLTTAKFDEVMYMTNSQEILPEDNIHSAQGCSELPCTDDDSLYFRISPTAFNHLYTLVTQGSIFYPDYVAAAIPPGVNRCTTTSYGLRLKFLMRGWEIQPQLVRASCEPVYTRIEAK